MRILKAQELAQKTSMSVSNIRRMAREGNFPEPITLTEKRCGWLETEVDEWISSCVRKHHAGGKYAK